MLLAFLLLLLWFQNAGQIIQTKLGWGNDGDASCRGKEEVLEILRRSTQSYQACSASLWHAWLASEKHVFGRTTCRVEDLCDQLPTWRQVTDLYGDRPVVLGMERCAAYRQTISAAGGSAPHVRVAGLYNTGTHALVSALQDNYPHLNHHNNNNIWDVPWGKHVALRHREKQLFPKHDNSTPFESVLPVVLVRDPLRWINSMCKAHYDAQWRRDRDNKKHCPNLVVRRAAKQGSSAMKNKTENDDTLLSPNPVMVKYQQLGGRRVMDHYESLADMWTAWNRQYYLEADFPRLLIRFEDLLFHREALLARIAQCATGGESGDESGNDDDDNINRTHVVPAQLQYYQVTKAKKHGHSSDLVSAIIKYGTRRGRQGGMTPDDRSYAARALDPNLLSALGYPGVAVGSEDG